MAMSTRQDPVDLLPTVSIVIPVHNGGNSFRKCLASVQAFVPSGVEVIVVVDGGSDDSAKVAEQAGVKVIKRQ